MYQRSLLIMLIAAVPLALCEIAFADEEEEERRAELDAAQRTVVVFPLQHSGEADPGDVEFLDNVVIAGFEELPQEHFSVEIGAGGGSQYCDDDCVDARLRESGGNYVVYGEIERRDSGYVIILRLVQVGDETELLDQQDIGAEAALSALVGPLTTAVDILRERVASHSEPVGAPAVAKKKAKPASQTGRARRRPAAAKNAALRRQFERKLNGGAALITLGVISAVGAFGLGFAYGLTGQWPYIAAGVAVEALGVVLIVSGSVARVRANRGMAKYGFASLAPGDRGGFDPLAQRLASAPRLGLALGFEF